MAKVKVTVKRTGGRKLERFLREAGRGGVSSVAVGFFSDAKYQDGTPVAAVAAWNEFGTKNIPERPFFRQAIAGMEDGIANIIKARIGGGENPLIHTGFMHDSVTWQVQR